MPLRNCAVSRMRDLEIDEQARRGERQQPKDDRFRRRRADVADDDLERRHRRRKQLVDRPRELGHVDAERRVRDALRQDRQHDEPRHDEGGVADVVDADHARTDRRAEDDEIKRRRQHRRDDALHQRAPRARHLELVDGEDRVAVHAGWCTRLTKMSSSELCAVCRSLKPMPSAARSRSRSAMRGLSCFASKLKTRSWPSAPSSSA